MNCDDFLTSMETGGALRRLWARLHASHCPRCSALRTKFDAAMKDFTAASPLTDEDRRVWERASRTPVVGCTEERLSAAVRFRWALIAGGGIAAAACVLVTVLVVFHQPKKDVGRADPVPVVNVAPVDAAAEYARLSTAVSELDREMRDLQQRAQADAARREVSLVLDRFDIR